MEKVLLPKEVAKAIGYYKDNFECHEHAIMKIAMEEVRYIGNPDYADTIKNYANSIDNLRLLMKALVIGYEVELTTEEKIKIEYEKHVYTPFYDTNRDAFNDGFQTGIRFTLKELSFNIPGVNVE